jgi:hypothetical protein
MDYSVIFIGLPGYHEDKNTAVLTASLSVSLNVISQTDLDDDEHNHHDQNVKQKRKEVAMR